MPELRAQLLQEINATPSPEQLSLSVPMHVLLGEAIDLAAYVRRHWEPTDTHPGLSSVARRFDQAVGDDLIALVDAVQTEHTAYRLAADPPTSRESVERGEALIDELTASLEFLFDDGIDDEHDSQLDAISDLYGTRSRSDDALAAALFDFATLAEKHRSDLDGVGGFNLADIDEALTLAAAIRARSSTTPTERAEQARTHRLRRNQLATVLQQKLRLVRAAARFAFRAHPTLARAASSAYQRRARASLRRRNATQDTAPAPDVTV